ncbi:phage tail tube protein [Streptomyces hygroscopicus]|uniref:phage tail tube protein n=1 Tax=Streptomyces hygroscopicus TaxID=1912 RepID=UPI0037A76789
MTTPTPTPVTALARRWRLEVNMGNSTTPDWQLCPAITDFQWSAEPNVEDSSTYDDDGWAGNTKTGQAFEVTATFNRKTSADSTVYHPVHEKLRAVAFGWGDESEVGVRWMDRNGLPEAYQGSVLVQWAPSGGAATDLDQVEVTLTGNGPLAQIDNPLAA